MTTTPINLTLEDGCAVRFEFPEQTSMMFDVGASRVPLMFDIGTIVESGVSVYDGSYEADALFTSQTFRTARKVMRDNFLVHAINYTEAPNDFGTTVTIGG